jgi:hypothetical protein
MRLERLLGPLGHAKDGSAAFRFPMRAAAGRPSPAFVAVLTALAATVILIVWYLRGVSESGFTVTRLEGTPTIASQPIADQSQLRVGSWLETNADGRASIDISTIGRVELEPRTRLGLISTRPTQHRLQLVRGTIHALIWAPPGQFAVDIPSSTAVDLGCAYTMTVDDDDVGHIRVTTGWVGFEWRGRESFIPAGATCLTRRNLGPGTPFYDDTSAAFQAALDTLDQAIGTPGTRAAALDRVLSDARAKDTVTLWHLLSRVEGPLRGRVFDRLAQFVPPPSGVTRDGVLAGQKRMLDDWWDTLGLGAANWWRVWKQQWRDR